MFNFHHFIFFWERECRNNQLTFFFQLHKVKELQTKRWLSHIISFTTWKTIRRQKAKLWFYFQQSRAEQNWLQLCWSPPGHCVCRWSCSTWMCTWYQALRFFWGIFSGPFFWVTFALSKLLACAGEWLHQHHSPNDPQSSLVAPQCSLTENSPISHHSHTGMHYTVKQKYLYFPGWLGWFFMPLT